ncbi:stromal cell-derived factor 2-like [Acanthaster planci]|uniref:Stromal cell-derived factor 2-like n=1 Tax=Acanthaster planci TaxID=133434 RepID=A0A8B7YFK0_ACAPL|nr:stromal cell-derived factor 2-like [Acanthaster planci]
MEELNRFYCAVFALFIIFLTSENKFVTGYSDFEYDYVTCGSIVKLLNTRHNVRLHSHDIRYGSGSGQQSVTGVEAAADKNSYWQVRGQQTEPCTRGTPVKCGSTIRLMHVDTRKNLHSHHFSSPLSHNQEVSGFGEDGVGDDGDNWVVTCSSTHWKRNEPVRFKHVVTNSYLTVSGDVYGRPIHGQREICTVPNANQSNQWKAMEGVYIKPTETNGRD